MRTSLPFMSILLMTCLNAQPQSINQLSDITFEKVRIPKMETSMRSLEHSSENDPATASTANNPNASWENSAQEYLSRAEYFIQPSGKQFVVVNRKQQLTFTIKGGSIVTKPVNFGTGAFKAWNTQLDLLGINGTHGEAANNQEVTLHDHARLLYSNNEVDIEYLNSEDGLRQNFIVKNKPATGNDLRVYLGMTGDLTPELALKNSIIMRDANGKAVLKYDGLEVWDAAERKLPAHMEIHNSNQLVLVVDDKDAVYPVTVDPLTHAAEWTTSANGVLPGVLNNLQLQVDALYGYKVAGVGDVNGDGYDDVAIGAPGAIDIIAGNVTVVGAGAVFVYFGSANGLPTVPSRVLRSSTPILNGLFGLSIAGGNVTGSTVNVKSDIIVGAPGESYSTSVSGLPATATVTAGKVYTFSGDNLAAANNSAFASVYLSGSTYFSNGVLNLLLSNVHINALFGFSVAAADDMNGDGLDELIVGAPGYAGVQLLSVRSGAAFVYYSSAIGSNSAVQLSAPTLLGFPSLVNLDGLLFGFSVDGAGDFNKDGKADVVVSAPGGLNLGAQGLLGGSAYIFKGTGAGVSTSIETQLLSGGPLLGSVANLFGYTVKGVKDAGGHRTGNIVVGAPVGNVLSNLLGGLRLKTGSIHVFTGKANPGATTAPDQTFSSPRSAGLLSILSGQNLKVDALFGAAIDNMMDANCDGIGDIIVGEPLSTGVGLINANAVGGAAYVFLGNADGTFNTTPVWTLENSVSYEVGINAGSLIGYSVAGAGHIRGAMKSVRGLVGAPGKALDFSTGLLNLGNTLSTTFSFVAGDNGLGKVYGYGFNCDITIDPDVNATLVNVNVPGNVSTNDEAPLGTTYGTPIAKLTNPAGATITLNSDGTYIFRSSTTGTFIYNVPVCFPEQGCTTTMLTIIVSDLQNTQHAPVAHTDLASTMVNIPVTIKTLENDAAGNMSGSLNPASVVVSTAPHHGTTTVDPFTGNITYSPAFGFEGMDTLTYTVCDAAQPTAMCATAIQVILVSYVGSPNSTSAADDYVVALPATPVQGNVKLNDSDPEGNTQTVTPQTTTIGGKGTLVLNADGSFIFTPVSGYVGPVNFTYTTCDNGTPQACAGATLYVMVAPIVNPDLTPTSRISNGTFIVDAGTTRTLVIEVNEINGNLAKNATSAIMVRIFKSVNFNYTFDSLAVSAAVPATISVNNPNWELVTNNSSVMIFRLKPLFDVDAFESSRIAIKLQVQAGAAEGIENQTFGILDGGGTELNYNNNSVVRILSIVQ